MISVYLSTRTAEQILRFFYDSCGISAYRRIPSEYNRWVPFQVLVNCIRKSSAVASADVVLHYSAGARFVEIVAVLKGSRRHVRSHFFL